MGNREFWRGAFIGALAAAAAAMGVIWGNLHEFQMGNSVISDLEHIQKIRYLEELIDQEYLGEVRDEDLAEGMYAGLIYGLGDPYSRYYTEKEYEEESTSTEGSYSGIGIQMRRHPDGGMEILECYEGGPGEQAGLKVGDIIKEVDGTDVSDFEAEQVVELVRDSYFAEASLAVYREGEPELLKFVVPIRDVEIPSVFSEMLNERTGYIRISEFKGVTVHQYQEAFQELTGQGMEKLVIDLRDNPGGLLDSVCGILEEILPEGRIVYTEDKYGRQEEILSEGNHPLEIPLAVLVNGSSASASEIFAGAVQDYKIGTIVGTATYGKGVVQAISRLSDGSAVKLTISQYFTPGGNSINGKGIQPDVEVEPAPELQSGEKISHGEDNQLLEALNVIGETLEES